jgi:hypothetical protein
MPRQLTTRQRLALQLEKKRNTISDVPPTSAPAPTESAPVMAQSIYEPRFIQLNQDESDQSGKLPMLTSTTKTTKTAKTAKTMTPHRLRNLLQEERATVKINAEARILKHDLYSLPDYPPTTSWSNRQWKDITRRCIQAGHLSKHDDMKTIITENLALLQARKLDNTDVWKHHCLFKQAVLKIQGIDKSIYPSPLQTQTKTNEAAPLSQATIDKLETMMNNHVSPRWTCCSRRQFRFTINGQVYAGICCEWRGSETCPIELYFNPKLDNTFDWINYKGWHRGNCDFYVIRESDGQILHVPDLMPYQVGMFGFTQGQASPYHVNLAKYLDFWNIKQTIPDLQVEVIPTWNREIFGNDFSDWEHVITPAIRQQIMMSNIIYCYVGFLCDPTLIPKCDPTLIIKESLAKSDLVSVPEPHSHSSSRLKSHIREMDKPKHHRFDQVLLQFDQEQQRVSSRDVMNREFPDNRPNRENLTYLFVARNKETEVALRDLPLSKNQNYLGVGQLFDREFNCENLGNEAAIYIQGEEARIMNLKDYVLPGIEIMSMDQTCSLVQSMSF